MSRLDEYIKRYEGLHTGKDDFRASKTGELIKVGEAKELFSGIQFMRKFPKYVKEFADSREKAITILDYGAGKGNMPWRPHESYKNGLWGYLPSQIQCIYVYDPCYPPFSVKPEGWTFDLIGCADVMEHVPEEDVDTVLIDLARFCKPDGLILFSISGNKAFKAFEDGENLHCTIRDMDWWRKKIETHCKRNYVLIHTDDSRDPVIDSVRGVYKR